MGYERAVVAVAVLLALACPGTPAAPPSAPKPVRAANEAERALKEKGDAFVKEDDLENAARTYKEALASNDGFAQAHANLGLVYWRRDELADAVRELDRALELDPALSGAHFNRGKVLEQLERYEAAIDDYSALITSAAVDDEAVELRQQAYVSSGFYRKQFEGGARAGKIRLPARLFDSPVHRDRTQALLMGWMQAAGRAGHRDDVPLSVWRVDAVHFYSEEVGNGGLAQLVYNALGDDDAALMEKIRAGLDDMGAREHLAVFDDLTKYLASNAKMIAALRAKNDYEAFAKKVAPALRPLSERFYEAERAAPLSEAIYQYIGKLDAVVVP